MKWESRKNWEALDGVLEDQNRKAIQFHSSLKMSLERTDTLQMLGEDADIRILVDYDGDGLIELSSQVVDEIKAALKK